MWRSSFFLLVVLAPCSLFETRDPEDPVVVRSTFTPPTEPTIVLDNLRASLREMNDVNYLRCLSDSLTGGMLEFIPTPEAGSRYGVFLEWSKASEREYFLNMKSHVPAGTSVSLVLGTPSLQGATTDSVQVESSYDLSIPTGLQAIPDRGKGRALFTMVLDRTTGMWSIRSWQDFSVDLTTASWSDVKGAFSQ